MPGVTVEVGGPGGVRTAVTDGNGRFVMTNVPAGQTSVTASLAGFSTARYAFDFDQRPREMNIVLQRGRHHGIDHRDRHNADRRRAEPPGGAHDVQTAKQAAAAPSQNVVNLQQRATGVLPVRIDVPRAGTSHQFVKPLVVDQETTVKLRYKRR